MVVGVGIRMIRRFVVPRRRAARGTTAVGVASSPLVQVARSGGQFGSAGDYFGRMGLRPGDYNISALRLFGISFVKACGHEVPNTENALDRRATSADLDFVGVLLQIHSDAGYLNLRKTQRSHGLG